MGMIYDDFGRFAIEGRRESFYIHASYGYKPLTKPLGEVRLGGCFRDEVASPPFQVVGHLIGETRVKPAFATDSGPGRSRRPGDVVIPVGSGPAFEPVDQVDDDHPLARIWREHPHPEVEITDLDDLIAALEDYRSRIAGGVRA